MKRVKDSLTCSWIEEKIKIILEEEFNFWEILSDKALEDFEEAI